MSTSWYTWACVLAYAYSFVAFGLQCNLLGPTASILARKLGVVEADLGIVFTINGFASIIGALPSGYLVDQMPGHLVLAAALAFEAIGFLCIPLCNSMLTLIIAFATVALSWNIVNTAGNTYVLWIAAQAATAKAAQSHIDNSNSSSHSNNDHGTPSEQPTEEINSVLINTVNAAFGLGSLAAPVVAEMSATRFGNSLAPYWITAACTAASAVSFLLLPSPRPPGSRHESSSTGQLSCGDGSSSGAAAAAAAVAGGNSDLQQPLLAAVADSSSTVADGCPGMLETATAGRNAALEANSTAAAAAEPSVHWWSGTLLLLLGVTAVFNLLNVGTEVGFGGWIFTYATTQAGLSEHEGHAVNAAYWVFFTLGRILASFAALVASPSTLLFGSLPLALLGSAIALAVPQAVLQEQGWLLLMAITMLVGLGASTGFANSLALMDSFCPCTGSITGVLGGVAGAGCMTVPLIVALMAKHTVLRYQGLMWVCLVSFGVQLACVPLMLLVGRRIQRERDAAADDLASVTKDLCVHEEQPEGACV